LATKGIEVAYLEGGFAGWIDAGLPTRRKLSTAAGKWVTRERPKIDRIACPWLIRRFIEPEAEFIYVPPDQVLETARETGATPYDVKGVEFTHEGERCSFDTTCGFSTSKSRRSIIWPRSSEARTPLATISRRNVVVCSQSLWVSLPISRTIMRCLGTGWSCTTHSTRGAVAYKPRRTIGL
jgi:Chromate resistance exported protein